VENDSLTHTQANMSFRARTNYYHCAKFAMRWLNHFVVHSQGYTTGTKMTSKIDAHQKNMFQ
jgi:hypothetical protein